MPRRWRTATAKPHALPRLLGPVRVREQVAQLARGVSPTSALNEAALHRRAIEQVAPPSILVDEAHRVVHLSDHAGRYLLPSGGPLSGDVVVGEGGWAVRIEAAQQTLRLTNSAVSTAGDTGRRHIRDARTGQLVEQVWLVSVLARTGLEADGLDTALRIIGEEEGRKLAEASPLSAVLATASSTQGVRSSEETCLRSASMPTTVFIAWLANRTLPSRSISMKGSGSCSSTSRDSAVKPLSAASRADCAPSEARTGTSARRIACQTVGVSLMRVGCRS